MFRRSKMFEHNQQLLDYMTIPKRSPGDYNEQHYNMEMLRNEDPETKSGATESMEPPSGDEDHQDPNHHSNKRKHYHRHTPEQIKEMELVFKKSPHPDDKQRKELGQRLGLEPLQVKFWFQNKRTQKKALLERNDNSLLRKENEKLREENKKLKKAFEDFTCPSCDGSAAMGEMSFDEQQLKIENDRLREELHRLSEIAAKYVEKPILSYPFDPAHVPRSLDLGVGSYEPLPSINVADPILSVAEFLRSVSGPTEADKQTIIELAVAAMEELIGMTQAGEPLWILSNDNSTEILCEDEYMRTFPKLFGPKLFGLKSEASRHSAVVLMNHVNLVDILMDVNQWSNVFSGIVSRATTLDVLSTGVEGNYNGALQVMTAEFQVPSPLVPTRENYFVRYCKQLDNGTWAVADISLDGLHPTLISRCRRRPSGCLIQELPNGYSKVTWVEHVEVDERAINNIYRSLLDSGLAFGAKRWMATLNRQCERLASAMVNNVPGGHNGVISSSEGRNSILKLAERMVLSFCSGVGASTYYQTWTTLPGTGSDDVKVMTRKSTDDPGKPRGILLNAATSLWIPASPRRVFGFLRDENFRSEWDILSNGGLVQEVAHIASGRDPGNCVSLLRVDSALSSQTNMLILQESSTDPTASYVVYSPVDVASMNGVLRGGDPDYVALLPSGFAIFPDGNGHTGGGMLEDGSVGSLLTIAFQILVDSVPTAKLSPASVSTVNQLIKRTVERIKDELLFDEKVMIHMQ